MSGRILVIGRTGQLAGALQRVGGDAIEAWGREQLDLSDLDSIARKLSDSGASAIINAAAYTAVDAAENDASNALLLNARAPGIVARACAALGAPFVHLSSDYVFDGAKIGAYVESDARAPLNVYGRSKAEGEDAVLAAGGCVVRTSWVFAAEGQNFVRTMLALAQKSDRVSVVSDQIGRPTWSDDLARVCLAIAAQPGVSGEVFHFAGADDASWADFAEGVFAEAATRGMKSAQVSPILSAEYPAAALRPANSRLDSSKFAALTGIAPRPWREALRFCFDQMNA
jgi:dTDP-4-dehydrorhamnose reductase